MLSSSIMDKSDQMTNPPITDADLHGIELLIRAQRDEAIIEVLSIIYESPNLKGEFTAGEFEDVLDRASAKIPGSMLALNSLLQKGIIESADSDGQDSDSGCFRVCVERRMADLLML
jgi:hypothetical protein